MRELIVSLMVALLLMPPCADCQVQNDFDGDGKSDLTYYTTSGSNLLWKALGSSDGLEKLNEEFGLLSDVHALASWTGVASHNPAIARYNETRRRISWKVFVGAGLIEEKDFGRGGEAVLAGGDFDGNGIADGARVKVSRKKLLWTIWPNMFAAQPGEVRRLRFGKAGDRVFFLNCDGSGDWLAAFGRGSRKKSRMQFRNIFSGEKILLRTLPRWMTRGSRPRPFPIQSPDGADVIGIVTEDLTDTTLWVYSLDGTELRKTQFAGQGTAVVGDYDDSDPGEEVLLQKSGGIVYYNPFSGNVRSGSNVSGTLLDEINVATIAGPTPVPTAIPTVTPQPTATP